MRVQNHSRSFFARTFFLISMAAATFLTLAALAAFSEPAYAFGRPPWQRPSGDSSKVNCSSSSLAELALGKVLADAAPVFGDYADVQSNTSAWYYHSLQYDDL